MYIYYFEFVITLLLTQNFLSFNYVHRNSHWLLVFWGVCVVSLTQEGLAAVFGNGLSSACVVNVGSQVTTVICIEVSSIFSNLLFYLFRRNHLIKINTYLEGTGFAYFKTIRIFSLALWNCRCFS